MARTHTTKATLKRPSHSQTEDEAIEQEVIDTSLHPDRAHHDELGRTEEAAQPENGLEEAPASPREQPATPIDIAKIDE